MMEKLMVLMTLVLSTHALDLNIVNQWNFLDFNLPYNYRGLGTFRPENTVFTGLEITRDRYFLAMPRLRSGVPATLATIPRNTPPGSSPILQAYPDWSFHSAGTGNVSSCSELVSVYRIRQDSCDRLWVLDSGVMTSLEDFRPVCPPKIMIFDLRTDRVVRTVVFPRQVLRPNSLLTNLVIDESLQGACDKAFVYISDTASPGIVVYNSAQDTAWRLIHPTMYPDPDFSDYTIQGETFTLMDGVVGLAFSPKLATLYFQPLATDRIYSIRTSALTKGPPAENEALPIEVVGKKASQGLGLTVDERDDTLYFSPLTETSLATWNPISNKQTLAAFSPKLLQFPAEIRWSNRDGSIYLLSTRFQKFFLRNVSAGEINLRLIQLRPNSYNKYQQFL
ncbi:major royal jelly protein 1-like [Coccinella septempunctata]|uniref:major royal jelly protein 1-like n=1 Tax=Coccinella septempunctata TaxID=41139 RepID=UPI001D08F9B6|nr:major royal jelly protein 1-like [Coccinella septempunctata]